MAKKTLSPADRARAIRAGLDFLKIGHRNFKDAYLTDHAYYIVRSADYGLGHSISDFARSRPSADKMVRERSGSYYTVTRSAAEAQGRPILGI